MKLFFSEYQPDYEQYLFPYQVWLLKQEGDELAKIYQAGFLPFRSKKNVFYLARSVRVNLDSFESSSENRRILRKAEDFEYQLLPISRFDYTPKVQKLCKDFAEQRFGRGKMTTAGIKSIFKSGIFTDIFAWRDKKENKEIGYALCLIDKEILHYAHVFYNPDYFKTSLGARMMLESVLWAKEKSRQFAYLGTCYDKRALYKSEFSGVEFFNGFLWSDNLEELKYLVNRQEEDYLLRDKEYLERFHQSDIKTILDKYGVRVIF